jgi:hypothetical protein
VRPRSARVISGKKIKHIIVGNIPMKKKPKYLVKKICFKDA